MSDLQILTGCAILITAYGQLSQGLTCWHWQQIVYLAWFSLLANQACLIAAQSRLYRFTGERYVRLLSSLVMTVMLMVAIYPTVSYSWSPWDSHPRPAPGDPAICYFTKSNGDHQASEASTAMSMVLVGFGFVMRSIRLHQWASVNVLGRLRRKLDRVLRKKLMSLYAWSEPNHQSPFSSAIRRYVIYRPLFAMFIALRSIYELCASMFFEVKLQDTVAVAGC